MKKRNVFLLLVLLSFAFASSSWGAPASPFPILTQQPDGMEIEIFRQGDEFFNWVETSEGYPLVQNQSTGFWEYARPAEDALESTGIPYRPQVAAPEQVSPHFRPSPEKIAALRQGRASGNLEIASTWTPQPVSGTRKILAIRVGFVNRALEVPASNTENAFFGATNSVVKYYSDQSRGSLQVNSALGGSSVLTVNLDAGDANGGNHPDNFIDVGGNNTVQHQNEVAFVSSVISKAAAQGINFASFDTNGDGRITPDELVVYLIVAGYEESGSALTPSVWAHAWSSWTNMGAAHMVTIAGKLLTDWAMNGELYDAGVAMPMGVISHELGHQFCKLPDLYDVNQANEGLGNFSLMAGGSWGREAGAVAGSKPVNLDAWSRYYLGWETPQAPAMGSSLEASSATVTFGTPYNGTHPAVRLASSSHRSTEYFLAEVRALSGWDAGLEGLTGFQNEVWPGAGILILHVDENIGSGSLENGNDFNAYVLGQNQGCMAVEANGVNMARTDGNADRGTPYTLWYSGNPNYVGNGTFTPTSNPNSNFYGGTSSNVEVTNISASGATMTATVQTDEPISPTPTSIPTSTPIPTPGSGSGGGGGGCSTLGLAPLGLLFLLPLLVLRK